MAAGIVLRPEELPRTHPQTPSATAVVPGIVDLAVMSA